VRFPGIRAVAFDLDGTLYHGGQALPGAGAAVKAAQDAGLTVVYLTNTSGRTRAEVSAALRVLDTAVQLEGVWTSAAATAEWLRRSDVHTADVLGGEALADEIRQAGIVARRLRPGGGGGGGGGRSPAGALVVGLDRRLDPQSDLCLPDQVRDDVARGHTKLVACNRDMSFPGPGGRPQPGCGVLVARVEAACGRRADVVVGKPSTFMLELVGERLGLRSDEILVVGDSPESDVAMARAARAPWVLIAAPDVASVGAPIVGTSRGVVVADLAALRALFGGTSPGTGG